MLPCCWVIVPNTFLSPHMSIQQQAMLLSLPVGVAADLLSCWLTVPDRIRLDSAYCNHDARTAFLKLIRSPECAVKSWVYDRGSGGPTNNIVAWANAREVPVERISLGPSSDLDVFESYLRKFGGAVTTVYLYKTPSRALHILTNCTNLIRLDCTMSEVSSALGEVLRHSPKLQELRIVFNGHSHSSVPADTLTSTDLQSLQCPSLQLLSLTRCGDPAVVASLVQAATNNDVLALFKCDTDGALHPDILQSIAPSVTVLSLTMVCAFPEDVFCTMVERCGSVTHLDLSGSVVSSAMAAAINTLQLQSIGLSYSDIRDDVLLSVLEAQRATLTEVLLGRVSLEIVHTTLQTCTKLTVFNAQCVDEDNYRLDLSVCSHLTSLSVIYQGDRQSQFLSQIAEHCTFLYKLQINVSKVSFRVEQLDTIVERCTHLRELTLEVRLSDEMYIAQNESRWQTVRPGLVVTDMFTASLTALDVLQ